MVVMFEYKPGTRKCDAYHPCPYTGEGYVRCQKKAMYRKALKLDDGMSIYSEHVHFVPVHLCELHLKNSVIQESIDSDTLRKGELKWEDLR